MNEYTVTTLEQKKQIIRGNSIKEVGESMREKADLSKVTQDPIILVSVYPTPKLEAQTS